MITTAVMVMLLASGERMELGTTAESCRLVQAALARGEPVTAELGTGRIEPIDRVSCFTIFGRIGRCEEDA